MSEQRSLYVNIKMSKQRLEQFFQSKPTRSVVDENWTTWWNSRNMYSPRPLTEIYVYPGDTNRAITDGFMAIPELIVMEDLSRNGEWIFSALMLSENFEEILPTLSWLKGIAACMSPEDEGVAIIYDYFWGAQDVMAHMEFKNQQAFLKLTAHTSEIDSTVMDEANATLKKSFDTFSSNYED